MENKNINKDDNFRKSYADILAEVENICNAKKVLVTTLKTYLQYKHRESNVRNSSLYLYAKVLSRVVKTTGKCPEKLTKNELLDYLEGIEKHNTYNSHLVTLKDYLAYYKNKRLESVKLKDIKDKDYTTKDVDIQYLLDACFNPRDRAMVVCFAKYGFRESELISIKMNGVRFDDGVTGGVYLKCVDSKTIVREVLALGCNEIFLKWLRVHPCVTFKADGTFTSIPPDAAFLCSFSQHPGEALSSDGVRHLFRKIYLRARRYHPEMPQQLSPHGLRHFATTEDAKLGLSEFSIKQRRGWSQKSTMLAHYLTFVDQDASNDLVRKSGIKIGQKVVVAEKICPRCGGHNLGTEMFCARCSTPLDVEVAMKSKENAAQLDEMKKQNLILMEILKAKDPKTFKMVMELEDENGEVVKSIPIEDEAKPAKPTKKPAKQPAKKSA